jgi:lipoprotein-anchoring transpeptidase ErfK/SrfK
MKKLLILLFVAAVVGLLVSKSGGTGGGATAEAEQGDPLRPTLSRQEAEPVVAAGAPSKGEPVEQSPAPEASPKQPADAEGPPVVKARREVIAPEPEDEEPAEKKAGEPTDREQELLSKAKKALALLEEGRRLEARAALTPIYLEARGELARRLRKALRRISQKLVFNPRCVEGAAIHTVKPGETLTSIGKEYGLNWRMIKRINGMEHDRLTVRQQLKIIPGPASIVAVKSEFRLALLMDGAFVKEYPIGIGKEDRTPSGEFVVDSMLVRPRWYKPGGGIVEYGEEGHLLGERWIGFADQPGAVGIGIHGSNQDETIGTKCSNGCIRMRNEDVIELYDFLQPGCKVALLE